MKIRKKRCKLPEFKLLWLTILGIFLSMGLSAQNSVSGTVQDIAGEPVIGASVTVKGSAVGTMTDVMGGYSIRDVGGSDAVLVFSYLGYLTVEIPYNGQAVINATLKEDYQQLNEVVVIGYGTMKKSDLTGSITAIGEKEFSKGVVTSAAQLITGKVAGVQITSNGGRAGAGSRIRIRGGASLGATNDPLIVLDGVPLDVKGLSGSTDILSTINPNDVESMNILKDASATAIYGSRASNGVIIITTKKGGQEGTTVNFSSQNSISTIAKKVDVMDAATFREAVLNNPFSSQQYIGYMGNADTDWQDEIYRNAFTTDNNLSVSGSIGSVVPIRVSWGFMSQDGILKTDNMKRYSMLLNLSPTFFDNHLSVNANLKGSYSDSFFGNGAAIGAAIRMDPTQPVRSDDSAYDNYGGYFTWLSGNSGLPNTLATYNPVALLNSRNDESSVVRSIGNLQLDYKIHFFPDLKVNLNLGYDVARGSGGVTVQKWAPQAYSQGGERSRYIQDKRNLLFESYLNYLKEFASIHRLEVMAGYSYQDWKTTDHSFNTTNYDGDRIIGGEVTFPRSIQQNTLISFFGRLNYTLKDKYLLTATLRHDGSSRFGKDDNNRWGTFPSVALAWRIGEEEFIKNSGIFSNLKLRLGYGITGQQEINENYGYLPLYSLSDQNAQYQFGNTFYQGWRPEVYDMARKWEETRTANIGLDFGFFNNRIYGSVDYYHKDTRDLLNAIDLPMGGNFSNRTIKNIGNMLNNGFEASINIIAIDKKDMQWDLGFNISHNYSKITKLTLNDDPNSGYVGVTVGGISGGTGNTVQMHSVGHAPNSFYLYKQLYYENGTPVEGGFADLNGDGIINEKDKYFLYKPEPDLFMGFNTTFRYKNWSLATSLRASIGNYMYNNTFSDLGNYSQVFNPNNFLMNTVNDIKNTQFYNRNLMSDYYLQNASFLKMDYVTLGYNFGKIAKTLDLALNFSVQNVFTVTEYEGLDPEIAGGIDNNFYPNPRIFILGMNLNF